MKTVLLLLAVFLSAATITTATPADSCLKMILPNDFKKDTTSGNISWYGSVNQDSIKVDSCLGSPTYGHLFGKRMYSINFPRNFYPFDTILDSGEVKGVSDISASHPELKNRFLQIQDTFGLMYFQGWDDPQSDSIQYLNPSARLFFENYQDVDFISQHIKNTIDSINDVRLLSSYGTPVAVAEKEFVSTNILIYPNPVKDYLIIQQNDTGKKDKIEIISIDGKKVLESEYKERIDVSNLQSGSYYLRIKNSSIKFIKE